MSKYVIIGCSAAGIGAVEAIREVDPIGTTTVIAEEPFPQYSRPMIADFISGDANLQKMNYRDDRFWEKNKAQALVRRKAVKLNLTDRYVELDDGDRINFEKLLIATGGKPFVPKIDGADAEGVLTFTTLSDAERLTKKIGKGKKAVVVGGGLIGVSVAEALLKIGLEVIIVELKNRILSVILDDMGSEIAENVIETRGITIVTGQSVQRIFKKDDGTVAGVVLTNGKEVSCDLVIIAIGVVPRMDLIAGTDIKANKGIIVDEFMHTSIPHVYACGDVAEIHDFVLGENRLLPLWPVAHMSGRIAGYNMAGKKASYLEGTAMSALKYFDLPIICAGIVNTKEGDGYDTLLNYDPARQIYTKIVLKDNMVVGMLFINKIERAGTIFYLMKNRVTVKKFKRLLVSENFSLASLPLAVRRSFFIGGMK